MENAVASKAQNINPDLLRQNSEAMLTDLAEQVSLISNKSAVNAAMRDQYKARGDNLQRRVTELEAELASLKAEKRPAE